MWDESLIESRKRNAKRKSWYTLPLSLLAHAIVIAILIGASYWTVSAVPAPVSPRIPVLIVSKDTGGGGPITLANKLRTQNSLPAVVPQNVPPLVIPVPEVSNLNPNDTAPATNTIVASTGNEGTGTSGSGTGTGTGPGNGVAGGYPDGDTPVVLRPDIHEPVLIRKVKPIYPPLAIKAHIQGVVILEAVISKTGSVENIRVLDSPNKLLTDSAVAAVRQWLYKPAIFDHRPISVYFRVTVSFYLK